MDSIFSALALEKLVNFIPNSRSSTKHEYDVVVYDSVNTEETLRLIGAAEKAKWYLKYIRNMAEKTDIGRVVSPSFLKLAYESAKSNTGSTDGKTSQEIWNEIEQTIEKSSISLQDPSKIGCYLVIDPSRRSSVISALRYWGCAIQAGALICGALGIPSQSSSMNEDEIVTMFSPLNYAYMPYFSTDSSVNWNEILDTLSVDAKQLLQCASNAVHAPVKFDPSKKTVTLFMPGFDKSEIKLYQYRGRSELLVEAGDQRRIIQLPTAMHGKVSGAKFTDRNLVVKLR